MQMGHQKSTRRLQYLVSYDSGLVRSNVNFAEVVPTDPGG
jgi:hypothetical protein